MRELLKNIRQLYKPVQPTVGHSGQPVTYTECLPDDRLHPFINCYWQLCTTQPLQETFQYRVVADGCMDIFFELSNPGESFVMGFCKQYTEFPLGNIFHYVGIRFLPTMFPQLFKINAASLSNRFEALDQVLPGLAQFITEKINPVFNMQQIKSCLDTYFLQLATQVTFETDGRLYEALTRILERKGIVNIETELDTGISPRQLRRLFEQYVGDSAKTFSQVVRFQHILQAKPSAQLLREQKLFFDAGYYDQAHFIKEFKHFYGITPAKAFG